MGRTLKDSKKGSTKISRFLLFVPNLYTLQNSINGFVIIHSRDIDSQGGKTLACF